MRRSFVALCATIALAAVVSALAGCSDSQIIAGPSEAGIPTERAATADVGIEITISPNTLVIESTGTWVTVHTDIAFSAVDCSTLALESIPAVSSFADNRGNLVVKFDRADVVAIVAPPEATLTLTGLTNAGEPFSGSDTITVLDRLND